LIAIDGTRGKDVARAASALTDALNADGVECAISRWDASGLFGELAAGAQGDPHLSPRALSLVWRFACDGKSARCSPAAAS
jgi:hypothetical protein